MINKTYIIAEAGVNHNGSLDLALRLIDAACEAKADAIKFQTFKPEEMVCVNAKKAKYQLSSTDNSESQLEMLERLRLDEKSHYILQKHAKKQGIDFLSTPFDLKSLDFLISNLHLSTIKISSGDLTNAPLLVKAATFGCNIILSTGLALLSEVEQALSVLAFGYLRENNPPSEKNFLQAYLSPEGKKLLKKHVVLLHCTSAYPTPKQAVNLKAMDTLHAAFQLPVGLSDHSQGIVIPIAAAARQACILEKHFTLNKSMQGPDHQASLDVRELCEMVKAIRDVELALGNGYKIPYEQELENSQLVRKSLVAKKAIRKGDIIYENHLGIKRPATGAPPIKYWKYINTIATKDYEMDEIIENDT